ncbi:MAG: glycosyltransferase family 39 protein [Candidatus Binatia bacterium]|nr:glycosyltransferase family 39 protein [Candidatus Binatia bacterium]
MRPLALAALFVLVNLGLKLTDLDADSLWMDEAITAFHVQQSPGNILEYASRQQNPPAYFLLAHGWASLFGLSEAGLRSLSAVLSSLTAGALFLLGARFLGTFAGVVAALLYTLSPAQIHYAQEARAYALVGLLCVASFALFFDLLESEGKRGGVRLGVVNALLLYTHYVTAFVLPAQALGVLLYHLHSRGTLRTYVRSGALTIGLFLPWLPTLLRNLGDSGGSWLEPPTLGLLPPAVVALVGSAKLAIVSGVLVTKGIFDLFRKGAAQTGRYTTYLLLWTVVPFLGDFAASQIVPAFAERYVLYASLGFVLLLGHLVAQLHRGPIIPGAALALLALLALDVPDASPNRTEHWRELSSFARAEKTDGTAILVSPVWQCLSFAYYFAPEAFADHVNIRARLIERDVHCLDAGSQDDSTPESWPARVILVVDTSRNPPSADAFFPVGGATGHERVAQHPFGLLRADVYERPPSLPLLQ